MKQFQLVSHMHLFQNQLDLLNEQFGTRKHKHLTPTELEARGFGILDPEAPVVVGIASASLRDDLVEAGFQVWVAVREYPRSITRPWERRTVATGYQRI